MPIEIIEDNKNSTEANINGECSHFRKEIIGEFRLRSSREVGSHSGLNIRMIRHWKIGINITQISSVND